MKNLLNEKYNKYLPSKKFRYSIVGFLIIMLLFFGISSLFSNKNHFFAKNEKSGLQNTSSNLTINNLLSKDTDGDTVMDWEEALWGTDINKKATFDGTPDAEYIKTKRKALGLPTENGTTGNGQTETDKFAQQFFASIMAMKQSGEVDQNTINNVSATLGQEIVKPNMLDQYTEQNVKLVTSTATSNMKEYYKKAGGLYEQYKKQGIGDELNIVANITASSSEQVSSEATDKLSQISSAYKEYAKSMTEMSVPENLAPYHLKIINSANNTGIAVENMIKIKEDPIVGISGLSQYQKYSADLIASVHELETFLSNNGIIS